MPTPTSPTLLLVLDRLGRTDHRELARTAVRELVALEVLVLQQRDGGGRPGSRREPVLLDGPVGWPSSPVLVHVRQQVASAPSRVEQVRVVRRVEDVAEHLARQPKGRQQLLALALQELAAGGLVRTERRRVLGLFPRTVHVRTPAGEAALLEARRRDPRQDGAPTAAGWDGTGSPPDRDRDPADSFDDPFDSSFDTSFDAGFDAGSASGGSDGGGGGGGDGGGGGGD